MRRLPPPPKSLQRGPLTLVQPLMLPMVQRPAAPIPPQAARPATTASSPAAAAPRPVVASAPGFFGITPERRALLNTIRYAEGTWLGGSADG